MKPCTLLSEDEQLATLRKVTVFSGVADDDLRSIRENCTIFQAVKGEVIITEGSEASEILILLSGRVKIVLNSLEDPIELLEFGPGSCIGEASVIGIQPHSATAIVTEDTICLVLLRKVLMQLFDTNKALFSLLILNIARELARRLHHTDEIILEYEKMNKSHQIMNQNIVKEIKGSLRLI